MPNKSVMSVKNFKISPREGGEIIKTISVIYTKKREKRFTMLIKRYSIRGNKASK